VDAAGAEEAVAFEVAAPRLPNSPPAAAPEVAGAALVEVPNKLGVVPGDVVVVLVKSDPNAGAEEAGDPLVAGLLPRLPNRDMVVMRWRC